MGERIKLDRVVLREPGMNVPSQKVDQYPTKETVLVSKERPSRLSSSQHFNLWLDKDDSVVIVAHPDAEGEPERVPLAQVMQYRESPRATSPERVKK